jgi:hypothetical protein
MDDRREHTAVPLIDQLYGLGNNPRFFQSHLNKAMMMTPHHSAMRDVKMENLTRVPTEKLSKLIDALVELYGKDIGVKKRLTERKAPRADLEQEYHELKMLVEFFHLNKYLSRQPTMGAVIPLEMLAGAQPLLAQFNGMLGGMGAGMGGAPMGGGMGGTPMGMALPQQTASQALRAGVSEQRRTTLTGLNQVMTRQQHRPFRLGANTERVSLGVNNNTMFVGRQQDTNVLPISMSRRTATPIATRY